MRRWLWHPGTPRAKERPRLGRSSRGGVTVRTGASTRHEEDLIGWEWRMKYPDDVLPACPVWVSIIAVGGGADCDNIAKLVLDALNGVAYVDDRQVKRLSVRRLEGGTGAPSGTYIEVRPLCGPWRAQLAKRLLRITRDGESPTR